MRKLSKDEVEKRGCEYCMDYKFKTLGHQQSCKFDACPYHELDDYDTYDDYLKSKTELSVFNFLP